MIDLSVPRVPDSSQAAGRHESGVPGVELDFMEWRLDLLPGVSVELVELSPGVDLSEIFIKPGTMLELDDIDFLESKIAL